jgi:hypothetical protein
MSYSSNKKMNLSQLVPNKKTSYMRQQHTICPLTYCSQIIDMATSKARAAAATASDYSKQFILHSTAIGVAILFSSNKVKSKGYTRNIRPGMEKIRQQQLPILM